MLGSGYLDRWKEGMRLAEHFAAAVEKWQRVRMGDGTAEQWCFWLNASLSSFLGFLSTTSTGGYRHHPPKCIWERESRWHSVVPRCNDVLEGWKETGILPVSKAESR